MVRFDETQSLHHFLQDHESHLTRLRKTGRPEVLTVDGQARVVMQDAQAYQQMVELLDTLDAGKVLRERLASLDTGEPGVAAEDVVASMRQRINGDAG